MTFLAHFDIHVDQVSFYTNNKIPINKGLFIFVKLEISHLMLQLEQEEESIKS